MRTQLRMLWLVLALTGIIRPVMAEVIWQEAESFGHTGKWSNDSQHVDIMGSPYLLATGVGRPVADAVTTVSVPKTGSYTLWVRCRDWHPSHSPGRFQVVVNGTPSTVTFGKAEDDAWQWVDGGSFKLTKGEVELRLTDTTGWWGRCDAVVLATGDFKPANELDALARQRLEHAGASPSIKDMGQYDLVVVGGGPAGIGAAVAAARHGITVAFIQDRPVLGGNASSEIMVPPQGTSATGIAEEIYPETAWENFADSDHALKVVTSEPNISLFLNTRATDVQMKDDATIAAVIALDVRTGQRMRFSAPLFADTTGHGWIGYYAGAQWRMGTEARWEFDESLAPLEATPYTMGNCLYRADFRDMGKPDSYEAPAWAYQYDAPDDFVQPIPRIKDVIARHEAFDTATRGPGRPIATTGDKRAGAFTWYVEFGGTMDIVKDAEKIRDELFRLHMGLWRYAKKHNPEANGNLRMVWLNYVPGVRESRRLIGDYIMTQKDYDEDQGHRDLVAFTTWGIDDHHPHGFFTKGIDVIHVYGGRFVGIPYRTLYSRNIDNLFMAGRCMSASHMATAGVRVMRPMVATGQAIGTAAAIATRYKTTPRGVYERDISELQQLLLRDGCYIPGVGNGDPRDLALMADTRFPTIINGWNNELKPGSRSVPWKGDEPIELRLRRPATVACVQLSLANRRSKATFAVEAVVDGSWKELVRSPGTSKQRRYVYNVESVETDQLRFRLIESSAPVAITEVRVYSQPGQETKVDLPEPVSIPPILTN